MSAGLIPSGHVDTRSIADVQPSDLTGFTQCHFFAGIGGWAYALRLVGWPDDCPVWTGSCPCQPFSAAGKQRGTADERHLWPEFCRLIAACKPQVVFGEQVASAEVLGTDLEAAFVEAVSRGDCAKANKLAKRLIQSSSFHYQSRWLDGISDDMEAIGYTVRSNDIPACGVGAPHIRQRLYWVADMRGARLEERSEQPAREECQAAQRSGDVSGLADSERHAGRPGRIADESREGIGEAGARPHAELGRCGNAGGLEHPAGDGREQRRAESGGRGAASGCGVGGMGDAEGIGRPGRQDDQDGGRRELALGHSGTGDCGLGNADSPGSQQGRQTAEANGYRGAVESDGRTGFWSDFDIIPCLDGKARRIEPVSFWLVDGLSKELVDGWTTCVATIENKVRAYAEATKANPSEVLRTLRKSYGEKAFRPAVGGSDMLSQEEILFAALCELPRKLGKFSDGQAQGFGEGEKTVLRGLREAVAVEVGTSRSSLGREHAQQFIRELNDAVSKMPQATARFLHSFPIIGMIKGRVGLLRGYGNAIVPQVAAEFIRAFCEARNEVTPGLALS
jgi:DNA (cytosine-5)-methyltransferase 1